jgi:hypothetical protein
VRKILITISAAALLLAALITPSATAGALGTTYHVTTGECSGAGSILEAVAAANASPGADTILIDVPSVHLFQPIAAGYVCAPPTGSAPFVLKITESVTIDGQGAEFSANPAFLDPNGFMNDVQPGRCPAESNDHMVVAPVSFVEIGTYGQDNSLIEVTLQNMNVTKMSRLASVHQNATLTINALNAENITDLSANCDNAAIRVETGGNLTITDSWFNDSVMAGQDFGSNAFIFASGAGNLTIRNSLFSDLRNTQAVRWTAPSTKKVAIVSSQFQGAGGMTVGGTDAGVLDAYLTNSIVRLGSPYISSSMSSADVIIAGGYSGRSALHVQASTILMDATECRLSSTAGQCLRPADGMIVAHQNASIELTHTAIGVSRPNTSDNNLALFAVTGGGTITGDQYSWAQPTNTQNAAAISAVVGNSLITSLPGLYAGGFYPGDAALTPLFVFGGTPGVLIDAIPNAAGAPSPGANVLRDPLTDIPIQTDVWGNPRWDGNGASNIGAIQTTLAPLLVVSGVGDTTVDLTWSQVAPVNPAYPVDKFVVSYRPVGSSDPWSTIEITDPSQCFTTVTGLTNGVNYEFVVHAHAPPPVGDMPDSNSVTATPLGLVGTPQPGAQGGPAQIELFWTDPPTGGHPGPLSYYVLLRPVGTTTWINGPGPLSGRVTIIPELLPNTQYELGVFALAADGVTSVQIGTTFAATDPDPAPTSTTDGGSGGQVIPEFTG